MDTINKQDGYGGESSNTYMGVGARNTAKIIGGEVSPLEITVSTSGVRGEPNRITIQDLWGPNYGIKDYKAPAPKHDRPFI